MASFGDLPKETALGVLALVPAQDLVRNCRRVCSAWRDMADAEVLWRRKCRRDGYYVAALEDRVQDWRCFYFLCSLERNLVRNPCAEDGLASWEFDGQDNWEVYPWTTPPPFPDPVTSGFEVCSGGMKKQLITLKDFGYWDELMDEIKPDIALKDWTSVYDIDIYILDVKLLDKDFQVLRRCETKDVDAVVDEEDVWAEVSYTFRDYPRGVRHVLFEHGISGVDSATLTNSWVTIRPNRPPKETVKPHTWDS